MADSFTQNLGLTKPEVGASSNTWGVKLNADMDIVDGVFTSASTTPVAIVLRDDMKFVNATTTSQQVLLSCAGISTGTQRTLTAPDASGTIALQSVLRGYIGGLTLSNDSGTPNSKIDVSAGGAMDDTNAFMLSLPSTVVNFGTNGANGLDTLSPAPSTWYHIFAIGTPGAVTTAGLASTSLTPSMPATYTLKRRIGSVLTDASAHILAFTQNGDLFQLATEVRDVNASTGGNKTLPSVPLGIQVQWQGRIDGNASGSQPWGISVLPTTMTWVGSTVISNNTFGASAPLSVMTNTSQQVQVTLVNSVGTYDLWTIGWIDRRGRDA